MGKLGGSQKLRLQTVRTACLAILVLVFTGCGGSSAEGAGGDTGPRGNGGTGGAPECTSSDPCDAPQVCEPVTQTCVTPFAPCTSQAECTGGTYCEETADLCLPSSVGTPCAGPDNCNGECLSGFCGCSGVAHERQLESSPLDIYLVLDRTGQHGRADCAYVEDGRAAGSHRRRASPPTPLPTTSSMSLRPWTRAWRSMSCRRPTIAAALTMTLC